MNHEKFAEYLITSEIVLAWLAIISWLTKQRIYFLYTSIALFVIIFLLIAILRIANREFDTAFRQHFHFKSGNLPNMVFISLVIISVIAVIVLIASPLAALVMNVLQ